MLKVELKKAFRNRYFYSAMLVSMSIAVLSAILSIRYHLVVMTLTKQYEPEVFAYPGASLYNSWIGADGRFLTHLFYFIIFLLCTIPYSWSLATEKNSGYANHIITRTRRKSYYWSKYIAAFISGGCVALIPMLTNFLLCALFIPAYPLDQLNDIYIGVSQNYMWSAIFYTYPLLYVLMYIVLSFVFTGLWATVGISLGFLLKKKLSILILPFLCMIFVQIISVRSTWSMGRAIIPAYLLTPRAYGYGDSSWEVVAIWLIGILVLDCVVFLAKGRKSDAI